MENAADCGEQNSLKKKKPLHLTRCLVTLSLANISRRISARNTLFPSRVKKQYKKIKMWVFPQQQAPPAAQEPAQTHISYRVNAPKLTMVMMGQTFHYFKLRLVDIDRFFQEKKSWNKDYPPGQQIYSDSPTSAALRAAIHTEHTILYSGRNGRDGNNEGIMERTPESFFDLLEKNRDKASGVIASVHDLFYPSRLQAAEHPEDPEVYTYVLLDKSLRFSRCGAGMRVDFSSKHALHAGAAYEVFYAGEFWIERDPATGAKVLYIDNNSGTFAPPGHDLWRIKGLFEANFPNIIVEVLDYQDPRWKVHRKKE